MKKWSTFFFLIGILFILLSVLSLLSMNIVAILGAVLTAISFFFLARLCTSIGEILDNQKKIIIMLDNMTE